MRVVELSMSELLPEGFFTARPSVAHELASRWSFSEAAGAPAEGGWHWAIDPLELPNPDGVEDLLDPLMRLSG